jgi:hypothetical protein
MQIHQHKQRTQHKRSLSLFVLKALAGVLLSACATTGGDSGALESSNLRLMEASITKDQAVVQSLLAPDFTWREDEAPLQETPFEFWNRHNLWVPLNKLLNQKTFDQGAMKIAPREAKSASYKGPRLAWRKVGDEWRLAYFYAGSAPQ